jgi:hypothetical protein
LCPAAAEHRVALAVAPAIGEELAVEGGDAGGGEPLQLQAAQGRNDVDLQVGPVVDPGRGAQPSLDRRKPLLEQEGLDAQLGRLDEGPLWKRASSALSASWAAFLVGKPFLL